MNQHLEISCVVFFANRCFVPFLKTRSLILDAQLFFRLLALCFQRIDYLGHIYFPYAHIQLNLASKILMRIIKNVALIVFFLRDSLIQKNYLNLFIFLSLSEYPSSIRWVKSTLPRIRPLSFYQRRQ